MQQSADVLASAVKLYFSITLFKYSSRRWILSKYLTVNVMNFDYTENNFLSKISSDELNSLADIKCIISSISNTCFKYLLYSTGCYDDPGYNTERNDGRVAKSDCVEVKLNTQRSKTHYIIMSIRSPERRCCFCGTRVPYRIDYWYYTYCIAGTHWMCTLYYCVCVCVCLCMCACMCVRVRMYVCVCLFANDSLSPCSHSQSVSYVIVRGVSNYYRTIKWKFDQMKKNTILLIFSAFFSFFMSMSYF